MAIELELELELDSRRNDNHDDDDDAHKKIHFLLDYLTAIDDVE